MVSAVSAFAAEEKRPPHAKVTHKFKTTQEMGTWLADEKNLKALAAKYPPPAFAAKCDLIDMEVFVWRKDGQKFD